MQYLPGTIGLSDFAKQIGRTYASVRGWVKAGRLGPITTPPGCKNPMLLNVSWLVDHGLLTEATGEIPQLATRRAKMDAILEIARSTFEPGSDAMIDFLYSRFIAAGFHHNPSPVDVADKGVSPTDQHCPAVDNGAVRSQDKDNAPPLNHQMNSSKPPHPSTLIASFATPLPCGSGSPAAVHSSRTIARLGAK